MSFDDEMIKPLPLAVELQLFPSGGEDYRPMVYFPTPYVRHSFLTELRYNPELREAVNRLHKNLTGKAVGFAAEVFARIFAPRSLLVAGRPEFRWAEVFHQQLGSVHSFVRYQRMYAGDAVGAALATRYLIAGLCDAVPEDTVRQPDPDACTVEEQATEDSVDAAYQRAEEQMGRGGEQIEVGDQVKAAGQDLFDKVAVRSFGRAMRTELERAASDVRRQQELLHGVGIAGDGTLTGDSGQRVSPATKVALSHRLRNNRRLREITKLAGRFRMIASAKQRGTAVKGPKEMTGFEMGDDLSRIVASDLVWLGDPDMEAFFDQKYVEKRLLQYRVEHKPPMGRGPIVFCIDVSASMEGDRDLWAKALFAGVAEVALKQKRWCYAINFNGQIVREDAFNPRRIDPMQFLDCIGVEPFGGTRFDPPIARALELIEQDKEFKKADIIFLTDGEAELPCNTLSRLREVQKKTPVTVQGILVGSDVSRHELDRFCDNVLALPDVLSGAIGVAEKLYTKLASG